MASCSIEWAAHEPERQARRHHHARILRLEIGRPSAHRERAIPTGTRSCRSGAAADRNYAPHYPGITESNSLRDWDPPFPLDLHASGPPTSSIGSNIAPRPKPSSALARGRQLWGTRFGSLTSIRISPPSPAFAARAAGRDRSGADGTHGDSSESAAPSKPHKAPPTSANTSSTSASS